ncbi:EscD/YscD/HrpQ family type III secretion system inner membrane ring protein [Salmonella enterica subsp. enterica serovar Bredeney]|nr:EscD/YscD/HrpQ family type III secretion system inner membrane ring protein [Salmonella enterica subsp. enterica serovar Bredeney]
MSKSNLKMIISSPPYSGQVLLLPVGHLSVGTFNENDIVIPLSVNVVDNFELKFLITEDSIFIESSTDFYIDGVLCHFDLNNPLPLNVTIDYKGFLFAFGSDLSSFEFFLKKSKKIYQKKIFFACSLFLCLLLLCIPVIDGNYNDKIDLRLQRLDVYSFLKLLKLETITLEWNDENTHVTIYGRTKKQSDIEPFTLYLSKKKITYDNLVISDDNVEAEILSVLSSLGFDGISIKPTEKIGVFILSGGIPINGKWTKVERQLLKIEGLNYWIFDNVLKEAFDDITKLLDSYNILDKVSVNLANDSIILNAYLKNDDKDKIDKIKEEFSIKHNNFRVIFQNVKLPPVGFPFNSNIKISGNNDLYFLTLDNNLKVMSGQPLSNGYYVTNISPEKGVSLTNGQVFIHIPINLIIDFYSDV